MAKPATWGMDRKDGEDDAQPPAPERLERHFEDWTTNDATPTGEGLTLVSRQASAAVLVRECRLADAGGPDP